MIICNIIVIPNKKPKFQKRFIWRGQGYDCKWDFISNTKYNFNNNRKVVDCKINEFPKVVSENEFTAVSIFHGHFLISGHFVKSRD